jgi:hypothetical protein
VNVKKGAASGINSGGFIPFADSSLSLFILTATIIAGSGEGSAVNGPVFESAVSRISTHKYPDLDLQAITC